MNACVIICYTLIILFSYLTILQPQIAAPDVTGPGDVEFDSENSYILHTNDGEYWLVIDDTQQYMIGEDVANICKNSGFVIIEE